MKDMLEWLMVSIPKMPGIILITASCCRESLCQWKAWPFNFAIPQKPPSDSESLQKYMVFKLLPCCATRKLTFCDVDFVYFLFFIFCFFCAPTIHCCP